MSSPRQVKMKALLSIPRLGFTDNLLCCARNFLPLGIHIVSHSGAFWEQSLTKLMQVCIEDGDDYLVTVDYDSIFTQAQFLELLRLIESSGADAVFPVQMRRDSKNVLTTIHPSEVVDGKWDTSKALVKARSGHFGLTIIRCESLKKMPKPWLWSTPDPSNGQWDTQGPGRFDADVGFWMTATEHLNWRVYLANNVRIGHIQRVITWPTADWTIKHQFMDEYDREGVPV